MTRLIPIVFAATLLVLGGCATDPPRQATLPDAQEEFWSRLHELCGQAFRGRVVQDTTGDDRFRQGELVMHVRTCEEDRVLVPFHVGEDRSRTWVFERTDAGLRLKHDHRMPDGADDELTWYGGDTQDAGQPGSQAFHADAHTAELLPAAATNIWTVEIEPGGRYAYMLVREGTPRRFRVEFDLTEPVDPPPAPWGHE